jgi:hypothetical protein
VKDLSLTVTYIYFSFERAQYIEVREQWAAAVSKGEDEPKAGQVYGAEHLCRLIG